MLSIIWPIPSPPLRLCFLALTFFRGVFLDLISLVLFASFYSLPYRVCIDPCPLENFKLPPPPPPLHPCKTLTFSLPHPSSSPLPSTSSHIVVCIAFKKFSPQIFKIPTRQQRFLAISLSCFVSTLNPLIRSTAFLGAFFCNEISVTDCAFRRFSGFGAPLPENPSLPLRRHPFLFFNSLFELVLRSQPMGIPQTLGFIGYLLIKRVASRTVLHLTIVKILDSPPVYFFRTIAAPFGFLLWFLTALVGPLCFMENSHDIPFDCPLLFDAWRLSTRLLRLVPCRGRIAFFSEPPLSPNCCCLFGLFSWLIACWRRPKNFLFPNGNRVPQDPPPWATNPRSSGRFSTTHFCGPFTR